VQRRSSATLAVAIFGGDLVVGGLWSRRSPTPATTRADLKKPPLTDWSNLSAGFGPSCLA